MNQSGMKSEDAEPVLLQVRGLSIGFPRGDEVNQVLEDIDLQLRRGETLGVVGESGSGKSLTSLAIMGLLPENARVLGGEIRLNLGDRSRDLLSIKPDEVRRLRGKHMAMIFQEPMTSLNPVHTCGAQVMEMIRLHERTGNAKSRQRVIELFEEVELPRPEAIFDSYPHQISGGQKQRVMIAMALSCNPDLIIADEPTTALDVTVQKRVLAILQRLCEKNDTGLIFITHDLGVVSTVAQKVMVMYRGRIVESGEVKQVLHHPIQPYTKALVACRPRPDHNPKRLPTVEDFLGDGVTVKKDQNRFAESIERPEQTHDDLIRVNDLSVWFESGKNRWGKPAAFLKAVDDVSFVVKRGETLGLVGESGCGKSTLGRALLRLVPPKAGEVIYDGKRLFELSARDMITMRRRMQLIFQDPYGSLNPGMTIGDALLEPMVVHKLGSSPRERRSTVMDMLSKVGLSSAAAQKYPHEFSGGQRQRICIARALIVRPEFVICDESVSALDVSVQAQVLNLLNDLKEEFGLTYIFISHDLSVVKYMSDRLIVMRRGRIEEMGDAAEVYARPQSAYTRELISAIPLV